jgi:hypothetical protein
MVTACAGRVIEAVTVVRSCKVADGNGKTIHDRHCGIIEQETVADEAPQSLFDRPQVGGLSHKGQAIHARRGWKEMCKVAAEVVKHFLTLGESLVCSYDFHRNDQAHGQFEQRSSFAQAFSFRRHW